MIQSRFVGEENKKHFDYMQSGFQFGMARGHWILLSAALCTHAYIPQPEFAGARQQEGNPGFAETKRTCIATFKAARMPILTYLSPLAPKFLSHNSSSIKPP